MPTFLENRIKNRKVKKNSKFLSFLFIFITVLLFFLLIINISDIFSSLITNKSSLFYAKKLEVPSYTVYAVSIKDFNNEEEAQSYSFSLKKQGGAGVVYVYGEYYVLASAYQSLIDAQEVKNNLINDGFNAKILNLKVLPVSKLYKGGNQKKYEESISFFKKSFIDLYEASVKFDKGEIKRKQVNNIVAKLLTLNQEYINILNKVSDKDYVAVRSEIKEKLKETKEILEELFLTDKKDLEFSSKIKETTIKITEKNARLNKKLSEI